MKLNKEGKEITPEMGKPSIKPTKKFIEEIEVKMKSREEILAQIHKDRITLKGGIDSE